METPNKTYTKEEVRKLRDNIYGPCKDTNWEACSEKWNTPENIIWLEENQPDKTKQRVAAAAAKMR